jgi:hypothetical protein
MATARKTATAKKENAIKDGAVSKKNRRCKNR